MLVLYFGQILKVKNVMKYEFELTFGTSGVLEVLRRYENQMQIRK